LHRPRALIIGGSLAGLFAANLLRSVGWDAVVFERSHGALMGRGSALGTQDALFSTLRRIGIDCDASMQIGVRSHVCLDRLGRRVCEVPMQQVATTWDRIYGVLKAALPAENYRSGWTLGRFEQDTDRITAIFTDGSRVEGDLLVGADGLHSTVRRQLLPDVHPSYAGYVAWRGVAAAGVLSAPLRELLFHHIVFFFPVGELALSVPMAPSNETADAERRCAFVWFRPADYETTLPKWCTDSAGRRHGVSIPPPLIRAELRDRLRADASELLAPQLAALVGHAEQPFFQPIYDLETPRMVFGRAVLLGDAAFVARPHAGTGVTKAALDAQALADTLAGPDATLANLADYERERKKAGSWLVARGRHLGSRLEDRTLQPEESRPLIEAYLGEYGPAGVVEGERISAHLG
jgi:2-polyprenyl-6-methoxyphenol hydroxylase-like FAD-dependent oxidoreductase